METADAKVCRLCFTSQTQLLNILDGLNSHFVDIITEHIGEVNQSDALPKCICVNCWEKCNDFHEFYRSVHNAQDEYLKQIVKVEIDNEIEPELEITPKFIFDIEQPKFVEVITNCDEFIEFADENGIKSNNELDETEEQSEVKPIDTLYSETPSAISENVQRIEAIEHETDSNSDSTPKSIVKLIIDPIQCKQVFSQHFDTSCDVCFVELRTLKRAISHYKHQHNNDEGYIKCCGLKLKRDKLVDDHIQWHLNPEIFKCRYCDRCMKTKLSLATHIANHRHPKVCTCDICSRTFADLYKLKIHMAIHSRNTECHICSKICSSKERLDYHLKFYHKSDEVRKQRKKLREAQKTALNADEIDRVMSTKFDMKCDYCDNVFKSLQEAQYHYMHEHQIADGYIQCCGMKFKKTNNIEGHVLWHLQPQLFKCSICDRECTSTISLRAHFRVHEWSQRGKPFTCTDCNRSYSTKNKMNLHMKMMHGIDVRIRSKRNLNSIHPDLNRIQQFFDMQCDVCKMELSSLQHAKLHYLEEHDIPDGYIKCCEMKFREVKNINDHLQYHINPNSFKCDTCVKSFARKTDLSAHMSQHKAVATKKFTCNQCGKIWKSKYCLDVHKRSHEDKSARTFPCDYCNRKFLTEKLQRSHTLRIHEADKKVKTEICEYCAKTFTTRKEVLSHIRSIHTENSIRKERAQCQICHTWLSNRYTLKEHMVRHNSEPQKCSQCDKISPNHHALLCHVREVHCERCFQCHLCPKTFKAAVALKDHIATHTGQKTHRCSFCDEAFIWRPNMYSHQKKAHPEEWNAKKKQRNRPTQAQDDRNK